MIKRLLVSLLIMLLSALRRLVTFMGHLPEVSATSPPLQNCRRSRLRICAITATDQAAHFCQLFDLRALRRS